MLILKHANSRVSTNYSTWVDMYGIDKVVSMMDSGVLVDVEKRSQGNERLNTDTTTE